MNMLVRLCLLSFLCALYINKQLFLLKRCFLFALISYVIIALPQGLCVYHRFGTAAAEVTLLLLSLHYVCVYVFIRF